MTLWVFRIFIVFLTMITLSRENCVDYFEEINKTWAEYLELDVPLIKTDNFQDTMACTANRSCTENSSSFFCDIVDLCDLTQPKDCPSTPEPETIPFYLFMCLMDRSLHRNISKHCKYVTEYSLNHGIVFDQTTPLPPTTALSNTSPVPTKHPETPTTTAAAAALPTNSSWVVQSSAVTRNDKGNANRSTKDMETENSNLKILFTMSLVVNVVLVSLAVYKMWQKRQNCRRKPERNVSLALNETLSEVQAMTECEHNGCYHIITDNVRQKRAVGNAE